MKASEFIAKARALIGTPYEKCDCIGVIRKSLSIECQGTNWLYRSVKNASKYRYLNERFISDYQNYLVPGMVVFKVNFDKVPSGYTDQPDAYHIGVFTGSTVIHSPGSGKTVCEIPFDKSSWQAAGKMKQVEYSEQWVDNGTEHELSDHDMIVAIYNAIVKD